MQTHREPWLCVPSAFICNYLLGKSEFLCGAKLCRYPAGLETYLRKILKLCDEWDSWDMKPRHQKHIPSQRFLRRGVGGSTDLSPKGIIQVKSCCRRKQHQGVATPLLSNNYSLLMAWFGQLKSAVYPGFCITSVGSKSPSFWQHHQDVVYLDANLSNPRSDNSI